MKTRAVVIGAGASGRGYIGRLLYEDGAQIAFIDTNCGLIRKLREAGAYTVYIGKEKKRLVVDHFEAYTPDAPEAIESMANADYIFVSVGEQNLHTLRALFARRAQLGGVCRVIVCENGISPKTVLREALADVSGCTFKITQGIIFCTTIPYNTIDILSEDYGAMPYDVDENLFEISAGHFIAQRRFDVLLARKIYTYNCLSACIAYLGYMKGYADYAAAANDRAINDLCQHLSAQLNVVIGAAYQISPEEQMAFSGKAMRKFTDSTIADTIHKNARNVSRKITESERLIGPIKLFLKMNENVRILCLVVACAMAYLSREEHEVLTQKGCFRPIDLLLKINPDIPGKVAIEIQHDYERLLSERNTDMEIQRALC